MNLQNAEKYANKHFNMYFPIEFDDFMKIRKEILLKSHEDKTGEKFKGDFDELVTVFRILKDNLDTLNGYTNSGNVHSTTTRTGESIFELGKGLPDLQNGTKCTICSGKGYRLIKIPIIKYERTCGNCDNGYIYSAPCKACNATGIFHTKSGFNVKCKACNGTKIHKYKNPRPCPTCNNKLRYISMLHYMLFGFEKIVGYKEEYHLCLTCKGCGEIPIYNPVFQKGAMSISGIIKGNNNIGKQPDNTSMLKRYNSIMKNIK